MIFRIFFCANDSRIQKKDEIKAVEDECIELLTHKKRQRSINNKKYVLRTERNSLTNTRQFACVCEC